MSCLHCCVYVNMDSQVPEVLVVVQVFVIDGREAALVCNVAVRRYKRVRRLIH